MMITNPIIKNDVWIDKLYCIFFPSALKLLLRAVKLSLLLFCFSASINIQNNSKRWIEPFSEAFSEKLSINKAKTAKAVWKIEENENNGTGFFISENEIVTNAHVVKNIKDIEEVTIVQEGDPRRLKARKIARLSIEHDLALLEVDGVVSDFLSLPEGPLNSSNVYALGYPNGQFQEIKQKGVLKEKNYFISDMSYIGGASGSPILNEAHQLAGVLYEALSNIAFFIEVETLKSFINNKIFLCEGSIQECFKSSIERIEQNTQEVKSGKDSYNISVYLRTRGDLPQTKWWLEKAAEQGFAQAFYNLAYMYRNGEGGGGQNVHQDRDFLKKAAEQDFPPAFYNLAEMYNSREGGEQDIDKTIELLAKAAEQGLAPALYYLGMTYLRGGVAQDIDKAIELLTKAAERSFAQALCDLGMMCLRGEGVEQNVDKAIELLTKAAEQGFALAQHNLALMYLKGEGMEQNMDKAIELFKKAAEQGFVPALYYLGVMCLRGEGVKQNVDKAIELLTKASEQGFALAQYELALMYLRGEGMEQNMDKAIELFKKAAEQGHAPAQQALDELLNSNHILHHNVKEMEKAPQKDNCRNIFRNLKKLLYLRTS